MHYTGTVWRPPYEAASLLLEVTAGCTHHRCRFCTLYEDLPFSFRATPPETVEADLREAQLALHDPMTQLTARLQGLSKPKAPRRVFLTGGNPFGLPFERLQTVTRLIRTYLPSVETVGCFSRVTDVSRKTDEQLADLARLGFDGLSVGAETGDDGALTFMEKGYTSQDIIEQSQRLDQAGISYHFTYLAGLSGAGRGAEAAAASAEVFNRTRPKIIGSSMLTVWPSSRLYQDIQAGRWTEPGELEKLEEVKVLVERLTVPVYFATLGASNAVRAEGYLPRDREAVAGTLAAACRPEQEPALRQYRGNLRHL